MDVVEFIQQSTGRWFSQRTSYAMPEQPAQNGKSNLEIQALDQTTPSIQQLCEQAGHDPANVLCAIQIDWDGTLLPHDDKHQGSAILVLLADGAAPTQGPLVQKVQGQPDLNQGRYSLGDDGALTLVIDAGDRTAEERIWFASENLRLRTCTQKTQDTVAVAAFCSEIRMGVTKPANPPASAQKPIYGQRA